jgi:hypothetical protein
VLETAGLLLHKTGTEMGRSDPKIPMFAAVEVVAAPIVRLAMEAEAFRDKAVPKGAGG